MAKPIIRTEHLSRFFNTVKAVDGVNPRNQTVHQVKNVVDWKKSLPKEKTDERKGSQ